METHRQFAILLSTLLLALGLPLWAVQSDGPDIAFLPGEVWTRGDGLGYNVTLNLGTDGHYIATWYGCMGLYGIAKGTWTTREGEVVLTPTEERDAMKGHLRNLKVLSIQGEKVLVPPEDIEDAESFSLDLRINFYAFKLEKVIARGRNLDRNLQ